MNKNLDGYETHFYWFLKFKITWYTQWFISFIGTKEVKSTTKRNAGTG